MFLNIHNIDQNITLELNSWSSPLTDSIWQFFSSIPVWIPMYVLIVALIIWKLGWKKGLIVVLAAGLTFGFCDQFSNLIKDAVGRIRPLNDADMLTNGLNVLEKGTTSFSFFSAHAANAFGLATCTYVAMRRILQHNRGTRLYRSKYKTPIWLRNYAIWMYFWAPMVAISRVFVGKHYLGDVLAGAVIGTIAGYLFALLASYICKRITAK